MIIAEARTVFASYADESKSAQMSAYMKNLFSFYGIPSPRRKALSRSIINDCMLLDLDEILDLSKALWKEPQREMHYLAMDLLDKRNKKWQAKHLPYGEFFITHNSWWDTVDFISTHFFTPILVKLDSKERYDYVEKLAQSKNMWLNRVAIIFQLHRKSELEENLLELAIIPHLKSKEFFHQKAIGWALRQYSKTNPGYVIDFLEAHAMSSLSKREATKYL